MYVRRIALLSLIALAGCVGAPADPGPAPVDLLLRNVRVVDVATGTELRGRRDVEVVEGRIADVVQAGEGRPGRRVVEGDGRWLIPGLWDAHVHVQRYGPGLADTLTRHGITSVRALGGEAERVAPILEALRGDPDAPTIYASVTIAEDPAWVERAAGFALEDGDEAGAASLRARLQIGDPASARAAVDRFVDLGADLVKIRSFASPDTFAAFAEAADARGLRVVGHAPTTFAPSEAVRAGLDSIEHGLIALVFADEAEREAELDALVDAFRDTNAALCPTTIANAYLLLGVDELRTRIAAIDDPEALGLTAEVVRAWSVDGPSNLIHGPDWQSTLPAMDAMTRRLHRAGVPILAGSDTGSTPLVFPGRALHDELERLVDRIELTPAEALRAATLAPARWQGLEGQVGEVVAGQVADLVLLEANPLEEISATRRIAAVVLGGRVIREAATQVADASARSQLSRPSKDV